jgi:hypothetical protein
MTASHVFAIAPTPAPGLATARCTCGEQWPIAEPIAYLIGRAVEHHRAAAIADATGRVVVRAAIARKEASRSFRRGTHVRTADEVAMALLVLHDELPRIGGVDGRGDRT